MCQGCTCSNAYLWKKALERSRFSLALRRAALRVFPFFFNSPYSSSMSCGVEASLTLNRRTRFPRYSQSQLAMADSPGL